MKKRWERLQWLQWLIGGCIFLSSLAFAQPNTFPPGEYLTEGSRGILEIKPEQQGRQKFDIYSKWEDGHQCILDGGIYQGKATLTKKNFAGTCDISFKAKGTSIDVDIKTPETCSRYCDPKAWFRNLYHKPAPGCDHASSAQTRRTFKKLYLLKDYAAAERTLIPLLTNCKKTMNGMERLWIRNDLALTQAKLGKGAACKATLKPLIRDSAKTDDIVCGDGSRGFMHPEDCDIYRLIIQATRDNLEWCAKAENGQIE